MAEESGKIFTSDSEEETKSSVSTEEKNEVDKVEKKQENENEPPGREHWATPFESFLSFAGIAVGLGNVWKFPVLTYQNGGVAFLIIYLIVITLVGVPLFLLEQYLGQFSSYGPIRLWHLIPAARGIGFGQVLASFCVSTYYYCIVAISLYYLVHSCFATLPWSYCNPEWATEECRNVTIIAASTINNSSDMSPTDPDLSRLQTPMQQYFVRYVLQVSRGMDICLGLPNWQMSLCLLGTCLLVFVVLIRGVKSSGKALYVFVLFPYVALTSLLIKASTLEGARDGIFYYLNPNWNKFIESSVWYNAISQAFFSMGIGYGILALNGSYNPFFRSCYKSAALIALVDTSTSIFAGFAIFAVLGHTAHKAGVDVRTIIRGGTELAFVSYPAALLDFDTGPQFFSIMFFAMLFCLGMSSAIPFLNLFVTVLYHNEPRSRKIPMYLVIALILFVCGLIYLVPCGMYILVMVDHFGGGFVVYVLTILEVITVTWIYGIDNLCHDLEFIHGKKAVNQYWRLCWNYFIPFSLTAIFAHFVANYREPTFGDYSYSPSILAFGWLLTSTTLVQVPALAIYAVHRAKGKDFIERVTKSFSPNEFWGPSDKKTREAWITYLEDCEKFYMFVPNDID